MLFRKGFILNCSYCAMMVALAYPASGAVRVQNASRSYAAGHNQVNMMQAQYAYEQQRLQDILDHPNDNLPVRVADEELARQIVSGDPNARVSAATLDACAAIYPGGNFIWGKPTLGRNAGGEETCVAVVEMRGYHMGPNNEDLVVARGTLPAGQAIKCNINEWPNTAWLDEAGKIEFPWDHVPTMEEVKKEMDEEQKGHAGAKIISNVIIGGVYGWLAGGGADKDGAKEKGANLKNIAIGAGIGGTVGAGSAYSGKVTGDVIESAAVNMAAGALIGNATGMGKSVLRIENCDSSGAEKCIWGTYAKTKKFEPEEYKVEGQVTPKAFYNPSAEQSKVCKQRKEDKYLDCGYIDLVNITLVDGVSADRIKSVGNDEIKKLNGKQQYKLNDNGEIETDDGGWYEVISAKIAEDKQRAVVKLNGVKDKALGLKYDDWKKISKDLKDQNVYARTNTGGIDTKIDGAELANFTPLTMDASDGDLIDFDNKARIKSTTVGGVAGAGLGGFAAYQGAQDEITERYLMAQENYKASLQKVYCATGTRFLANYNDPATIPNMTLPEE